MLVDGDGEDYGDEDESHFVERHGVDVEGGEDGLLVSHAWVIHVRDLGRNFKKSYLSDPCAHGVRSLGRPVRHSVQELFETL